MMKDFYTCRRYYVALLEVLIAFAIIALCILPLIYPQVALIKSEKEFIDTVELDHAVNLLYVNQLQKLYDRRIPFSVIEGGKESPIEEGLLQEAGFKKNLPFTGSLRYILLKQKPPKPDDTSFIFINSFSHLFPPRRMPIKIRINLNMNIRFLLNAN